MKIYSNKYQNSSLPINGYEFEVLNELKDASKRTDSNCIQWTRFLFEIDDMELKEQALLMKQREKLLVRATYSGSKSIHMIIEFSDIANDWCKENYKLIWKLLNVKYFNGRADKSCANPSRLTRIPNVVRQDNGKKQHLLFDEPNNKINTFGELAMLVNRYKRLESVKQPKPILNPTKTNNGLCANYDVVTRYIKTPFPCISGNQVSSRWLYASIACCIKYKDESTLNDVLRKARNERWTESELNRMINNIKK